MVPACLDPSPATQPLGITSKPTGVPGGLSNTSRVPGWDPWPHGSPRRALKPVKCRHRNTPALPAEVWTGTQPLYFRAPHRMGGTECQLPSQLHAGACRLMDWARRLGTLTHPASLSPAVLRARAMEGTRPLGGMSLLLLAGGALVPK